MIIRAPSRHGSWICQPEPRNWFDILDINRLIFLRYPDEIKTIRALFHADFNCDGVPLIMTGHQPDWFHPGVWAKNFLVYQIAKKSGGTAVNCVIDTDIPKSFAWVIPAPPRTGLPAGGVSIPFMPSTNRLAAWELQAPVSISSFEESLRRTVDVCSEWGFMPLARSVLDRLPELNFSGSAANQFSAIRRNAESGFGVSLKDCFLSDLSAYQGFSEFVLLLFRDICLAFDQYNQSIEEFKSKHGIDRPGRPVPLLEFDNGWFETPLWVFSNSVSERSRLWIKRRNNYIYWRSSDYSLSGQFLCAATENLALHLRELAVSGVRIRSRALMTSFMLRVFVSDLFVHGLGGCLYDEMTDRWIRGWLGIQPPVSMVCSMTVRLPLPKPRHTFREIQRLKATLREIRWHGESISNNSSNKFRLMNLVQEKEMLVRWNPPDRFEKIARCNALRSINHKIWDCHSDLTSRAYEILDHAPQWIREEKLLLSREMPWILHPAHETERIMKEMMAGVSG